MWSSLGTTSPLLQAGQGPYQQGQWASQVMTFTWAQCWDLSPGPLTGRPCSRLWSSHWLTIPSSALYTFSLGRSSPLDKRSSKGGFRILGWWWLVKDPSLVSGHIWTCLSVFLQIRWTCQLAWRSHPLSSLDTVSKVAAVSGSVSLMYIRQRQTS